MAMEAKACGLVQKKACKSAQKKKSASSIDDEVSQPTSVTLLGSAHESKAKPPVSAEEVHWLNQAIIYRHDDDANKAQKLWDKLNKESKAPDFYVHVSAAPSLSDATKSYIQVVIVPKRWWDGKHHLLDVTPEIRHLLPDYVRGELQEAVLEAGLLTSDHTVAFVTQDLKDRGFLFNEDFSQICSRDFL